MPGNRLRIGVVAPACRLPPETAARVAAIAASHAGPQVELVIHPQCFLSAGHFAGPDEARAAALVEVANDPAIDAVWFARGGYGSIRIVDAVLPRLGEAARRKAYLGYSDMGSLLAGLYARGIGRPAHGPMPADITREGGEAAVRRALSWLAGQGAGTLEPAVSPGGRFAAFNLTILSHLVGTPHMPDLAGHVLMLEEVSEHMYRIDRAMAHITASDSVKGCAGIRLGRCNLIPPNDPDFGDTEEGVIKHWCRVANIPWLGRADIGHDAANRIVPFGAPQVA